MNEYPEWRDITVDLPPIHREVLLCNNNGISSDERLPMMGFRNLHEFLELWSYKPIEVTHWMYPPLSPFDLEFKEEINE